MAVFSVYWIVNGISLNTYAVFMHCVLSVMVIYLLHLFLCPALLFLDFHVISYYYSIV